MAVRRSSSLAADGVGAGIGSEREVRRADRVLPPEEEVAQEGDRIGDVHLPVIVDVGRILARERPVPEEEDGEDVIESPMSCASSRSASPRRKSGAGVRPRNSSGVRTPG